LGERQILGNWAVGENNCFFTFSKLDLGFQALATSASRDDNLSLTSPPFKLLYLQGVEHLHCLTKRPKILPLLQRQQLQPKFVFAKKFQNHPRETQSLFICCESMIQGKLPCKEYGNAESDSHSETRAKEKTHTHTHTRHSGSHQIMKLQIACLLASASVIWDIEDLFLDSF
jgi:hypothetical protein